MRIQQACPRAVRRTGSPCVFCESGAYCPHQYYCPETRRYENSEIRSCGRRKEHSRPAAREGTPAPEGNTDAQEEENAFRQDRTEPEMDEGRMEHGTQKINKRRRGRG